MGVGLMGELKEWRSDHPNNYFAPRFQVHMWFDHIEHTIIDDVLEWVKDNEDVYADDRWEHYNVFSWDYPTVKRLKELIKRSYEELCDKIGIHTEENIWIRGWVYPMKKGMKLQRHYHALHENSFLSGNICLTENNTTTDYDLPYLGWVTTENTKGRMTLFPSSLPHGVDKLEEGERYSLAFDLITEQGMDFFRSNNQSKTDPLLLAIEL